MNFFGNFGGVDTISPQEAYRAMKASDQYVLLDVRTPGEYKEVRIDGAKLIPIDELGRRAPAELPDKDIPIYVYCRSGGRASGAVRTLKGMGYTKVANMGGILDWPYETVKG